MSDAARPDRELVTRRIRNQLIGYLEWAASFEEQIRYQDAVPAVSVPAEAFNQWDDWTDHPKSSETFASPTFSDAERAEIARHSTVLAEISARLPQTPPPLSELLSDPDWERLRASAQTALEVFNKRGRLSEDARA